MTKRLPMLSDTSAKDKFMATPLYRIHSATKLLQRAYMEFPNRLDFRYCDVMAREELRKRGWADDPYVNGRFELALTERGIEHARRHPWRAPRPRAPKW